MYQELNLTGTCRAELDTEVKFNIAAARAERAEIVRLGLPLGEDERDNKRLLCCLIKVLRAMMRDGAIQFYESDEGFEASTTEAKFLDNKYHEFIVPSNAEFKYLYVKM